MDDLSGQRDPECPPTGEGAHRGDRRLDRTVVDATPLDTVDPIREEQALGGVLARMFGQEPEPTRVGRYVIERRVGAGAMGVVYLAHDPELDRRVAIKLIRTPDRASPTPEARERLEREARALARVRHPNVVAIHDVGRHDGRVFVVMEYVEGTTLEQRLGGADAPCPWREAVALLTAAGRGLLAAHEAGLVHRDFKPTNVLVDERGRVQVTDFGLARERDVEPADHGAVPSGSQPLAELTTVGAVVGTPAFMAPELLRGEPADARSDQFAFCVTLWRAVFGALPYRAPTLGALAEAMDAGPPAPPASPRIPRWLLQVLRRGLDPDPSRRFPTMRALLEPLERRRGLGGWVPIVGVGVLAAGALGALGLPRDPPPCTTAPEHLARVWDDARRARVEAGLRATGVEYAERTVAQVTASVDRYGEAWVAMRAEACEATSVRGEQSSEVLDLRMACLDHRLDRLGATLELLEDADEVVVEQAIEVVAGLPLLSRCADVDALRADVPPPEDPALARAVADARHVLTRAETRADVGRFDEAVAALDALSPAVLEHQPLWVEAAKLRGVIFIDQARYDDAERILGQAYPVALRIGHRQAAAELMSALAFVVGARQMRESEARVLSTTALSLAEQLGDDRLRARALNELGGVLNAHAHYDEALARFEQAVAIQERIYDPDSPVLAGTLSNLALTRRNRGDLEEAFQIRLRQLEIQRRTFGDHPNTVRTLTAVGNLLHMRGDYQGATEALQEALTMTLRLRGPDHVEAAHAMANLGTAQTDLGLHAEAEQNLRRSLEFLERALGADDLEVLDTLHNLAIVVEEQGRSEEALGLHQRALEAVERTIGPDHPRTAISLNNVAGALMALHREAQALPLLQRAFAILRDKTGPDHPHIALVEVALGEALLAEGRGAEAEEHLRHAVPLIEQHFGEDHLYLGLALCSLGRVIHERGGDRPEALARLERSMEILDAATPSPAKHAQAAMTFARVLDADPAQRERARALAARARTGYEEAGVGYRAQRDEIDAWLDAHPLPDGT
ncbi:MAG: serine/threonine protein kinase [Myxococcales bacterium]|nr:serine/threonine protein kinase [Myxococcales bacterium]